MTVATKTIEADGLTITVREPLGVDIIDSAVILRKLSYPDSDTARGRAINFCAFVSQTVSVEGELGFAWADTNADRAAMQAAFEGWQVS